MDEGVEAFIQYLSNGGGDLMFLSVMAQVQAKMWTRHTRASVVSDGLGALAIRQALDERPPRWGVLQALVL